MIVCFLSFAGKHPSLEIQQPVVISVLFLEFLKKVRYSEAYL